MNSASYRIQPSCTAQLLCYILVISLLLSSCLSQPKEVSREEFLQASAFRLLVHPQEVIRWQYHYPNRTFPLPTYRDPQGVPLAGWNCRLVVTRRFFTDQSGRIYYRTKDIRQIRRFKSLTPASGTNMVIWPAETILILETYSKADATPLVVDCIRKFTSESDYFPVHMFFAGDWCYQRFNASGEAKKMVGGASACHQCHSTAFHLTGDLVFTRFSDDTRDDSCP